MGACDDQDSNAGSHDSEPSDLPLSYPNPGLCLISTLYPCVVYPINQGMNEVNT